MTDPADLGRIGIWWSGSWGVHGEPPEHAAAEVEALGYGTVWSSGLFQPGLSRHFEHILAATSRITVASGVVSIWAGTLDELVPSVAALEERFPGRFLLGLGASHETIAADYAKPYTRMVAVLDALDAMGPAVAAGRRVLAALGPRMLELAAARSVGAHPYFVPVEHTATARAILGDGPLLAPEVAVVLETDPGRAREVARSYAAIYLPTPNYARNLRRFGFGDEDFADGGSDRLIDAVIPWGDAAAIAARVREHQDAGADHVCLQVVAPLDSFPLAAYRELAPALLAG